MTSQYVVGNDLSLEGDAWKRVTSEVCPRLSNSFKVKFVGLEGTSWGEGDDLDIVCGLVLYGRYDFVRMAVFLWTNEIPISSKRASHEIADFDFVGRNSIGNV